MYGNGPTTVVPLGMPETGMGGGIYLAYHMHQPGLFVFFTVVLAVWTVMMATRAIVSLRPKQEE